MYSEVPNACFYRLAKKSLFRKLRTSTRPLAMVHLPLFLPPNHPPWYAATGHYASSTLHTYAASCPGRIAMTTLLVLSLLMPNYWKFGPTIYFATCALLLMVLKLLATMTDQCSGVLQALHSSRRRCHSSCPRRRRPPRPNRRIPNLGSLST